MASRFCVVYLRHRFSIDKVLAQILLVYSLRRLVCFKILNFYWELLTLNMEKEQSEFLFQMKPIGTV